MKRSIFISAVLLGLSLTGCGALSADKSSEPEKQSDIENTSAVDSLENINVEAMPVNNLVNNDDCESDLNAAFPSYSVRSFGNNWETVKTTESRSSFNGVQVDKGTPVLQLSSYAYDSAIDVPLGAPFPDLRIGDEQNGDYSVSFDFCADENGKLLFTMFDESEVKADDYLGQHRIYNNQKKRKQGKIRKRSAMFIFRPQGTLNQAVTENLSARYRFANANMIFSLAVCFRRPRYRVFRYWNSFLTIAKTCSTLHLTDDFSCSFFLA